MDRQSTRGRISSAPNSGDVVPLRAAAVARAAGPVRLELLGAFSLRHGTSGATALPKKAQALLAYLAMQDGRAVPRERLAEMLWGSHGDEQARRSLRQCLMAVRAALKAGGEEVLNAGGDTVSLATGVAVDVRAFETLANSKRVDDLEAAQALHRGEFLSGLQIASEPFGEWVRIERRRIASAMSDVLLRLASAHAQAGQAELAIPVAERLVALDPLREDGYRVLMQVLSASGRRDTALKHYGHCVDILRRELGVAPEPATSALAEAIRSGHPGPAPRAPAITPALALPDKPSIAVLPFTSLSPDADQDYFAEGMVEDIAITLGRVPWLFVIASSAAAGFKGRDADVREIASALGVRYVLRGSVRTSGESVRIVVQLIEAAQGRHIWADRFDGERGDVFAIQDRVTNQVTAIIAPALQSAEIERAQRKPTGSLTAYDLYLQALTRFRANYAGNKEALQLLGRAVEIDPGYAAAYGLAARCYHLQTVFGWALPSDDIMQEGFRFARKAAEIGQNDSEALWMAGHNLAQVAGELDYGIALIDRSLLLNPNSASAWVSSCFIRTFLDDIDTALAHFARAQRLNPLDSMHHIHWNAAAMAHFAAGRYRDAETCAEKTLNERPTYPPALRMMLAICGMEGRTAEGAAYLRRLLVVNPDASIGRLRALFSAAMQRHPRQLDAYLDGARRAGLPEN